MVSLVIDTDTASDDAIALLLALRHPGTEVRAVTVVAGNVELHQAVRNALVTLDAAGAPPVPVHVGCARPLVREVAYAHDVHGADGMGGVALPPTARTTADGHAVEALLAIARTEPDRHGLVTLGPLTNVAAAITVEPELLTRFTGTHLMLGAPDGNGNVSATAEFNAWVDPEAAAVVLAAPGRKTLVGWDISRTYAVVDPAADGRLRAAGRLGRFASDVSASAREYATALSGVDGYDLPDPVAMAAALEPGLVTGSEEVRLEVSLDAATRGQTFADRRRPARPPNTTVVTSVDASGFLDLLVRLLGD